MDLSNSVIMPRDDFQELVECAYNQTPATVKERIAGSIQTTIVCAALAGAVTAGSWGWAKAIDYLEERRFQRVLNEPDTCKNTK